MGLGVLHSWFCCGLLSDILFKQCRPSKGKNDDAQWPVCSGPLFAFVAERSNFFPISPTKEVGVAHSRSFLTATVSLVKWDMLNAASSVRLRGGTIDENKGWWNLRNARSFEWFPGGTFVQKLCQLLINVHDLARSHNFQKKKDYVKPRFVHPKMFQYVSKLFVVWGDMIMEFGASSFPPLSVH